MPKPKWNAIIFEHVREYGGPEEGGWWFDAFYPLYARRFRKARKARRWMRQVEPLAQHKNHRTHYRNTTYHAVVTKRPDVAYYGGLPIGATFVGEQRRPHYE